MAIPDISIAQFNKIANGDYNARFIDFAKDENGNVINGLFDNFTLLKDALGYIDGFAMYGNVHDIVSKALHIEVDYGNTDGIVDAIKQNVREVHGNKDYTIDIGV